MILEPLYYVSYATLVWGDLSFINFVDNTRLSQNRMAWLQWGWITFQLYSPFILFFVLHHFKINMGLGIIMI